MAVLLSKDGKFYMQNGKLLGYTPATKGDVINIDLDGNGNKQYRVLAINGTVAKLLGMSDISTSQAYNATSKTGTFTNGSTGQLYAGSDIDVYLNTTWYSALTSTAKAAIVPEFRTQYMYKYYDEPNTANTPTYTYQYQYNWSDSNYDNADLTDSIPVGNRNVFALDLKDIFDYFGKVCITSNELMKLWTNQTSTVSQFWWLSSANAGNPNYVWSVSGVRGILSLANSNTAVAVHPALNIDLSKISFTHTPPPPPKASVTPQTGIIYTSGLSGIDPVTLTILSKVMSNNTDITNTTRTVYVDYDDIHRKIEIGDQVAIDLNGTNYAFDVIGFNHDTLADSNSYGATTTTGKAGITFQMHDLFATTYMMNSSNTNVGGWKSSAMRTSTMPLMKGYMPTEWQAAIKPVNKVSGTGGGSSSGTETVSDSCFLLAEIEIFGSTTHSVSGEGAQYAYYTAGNSKVKNRSGSLGAWWERSPHSGGSYFFCGVDGDSNATYLGAKYKYGVAFGFCV